MILQCKSDAMSEKGIDAQQARFLINLKDEHLLLLASRADEITREINGTDVDVEQLHNIKKNMCSEDCTFCGQSAFYNTGIDTYDLPPADEIVSQARNAKEQGSESYCLVAAWREPSPDDFKQVCKIIRRIVGEVGISVECSLGFLNKSQAQTLHDIGVRRYNHNLETSRSMFPKICTTHTYDDRLETLYTARDAGLELCTGGIIGMGESREQRLELALDLARICPTEVTINILVPMPGTPMELQTPLDAAESARMFAVLRFLLPHSIIKISGGREKAFDDDGASLLRGGANGIITSGYLTTKGNSPKKDSEMIKKAGLGW